MIPLHRRQCLVTIIFTNLPSLHPFSFHEMILYLYIIMCVYYEMCDNTKDIILNVYHNLFI